MKTKIQKLSKKSVGLLSEQIEGLQSIVAEYVKKRDDESYLKPSKKWILGVGWTLIGTLAAGSAWLFIAETDEVVNIPGILAPTKNKIDVQVSEGGIVKEILVEEGQEVKKGDELIKLDKRKKENLVQMYEASLERLKRQRILLNESLNIAINKFEAESNKMQNEISYYESLKIALEKLYESGAAAKLQVMTQENRLNTLRSDLEILNTTHRDEINKIKTRIEQNDGKRDELMQEIKNEKISLEYSVIKAPAEGYIFDLKSKESYVANSSTTVMKIVGAGDLQLSIKIPAKDVGLLKPGQKVEVSIDSFPANEFGTIEGELKNIGSDALPQNEAQDTGYYIPGQVKLKTQKLNARGIKLGIRPGMSASANIKLRKVKYIELLLGNFRDKSKSLRSVGGRS